MPARFLLRGFHPAYDYCFPVIYQAPTHLNKKSPSNEQQQKEQYAFFQIKFIQIFSQLVGLLLNPFIRSLSPITSTVPKTKRAMAITLLYLQHMFKQ